MEKISDIKKYRPRLVDSTVERYLNIFGAICIEGPKWCGKTWTSSFHSKSEFLIGDPQNNFQNRALAELSVETVLEGSNPRLIDEWQEVPSIWDAVRYEVDKQNKKGLFILTGSSTPKRKGILHSGAGRIGRLRMRTMSLYEAGFSSGSVSLSSIFNGSFNNAITGEVRLKDIASYIVRGGWPGNLNIPLEDISVLPKAYLDAIIHDDSQRLDGIRYDISKLELLLRSLARNESTTATKKKLLDDIKEHEGEKIDEDTITTYLNVFSRLFLLDNQQPFSTNTRSRIRVKQAEKRHFCDPSLACSLLKLTPEMLIGDLETFGFMFEALVERDLKIYADSIEASLFHYQDYDNNEFDAVIELKDGRWCAIEIKLGANQIDKAALNLIKISESIRKKGGIAPSFMIVICGLSNAAYRRPDGVYVIPITALRP